MSIPIILLNRDRLTTTERLVDQLVMLGYDDITILDMDSTYPELLAWYDSCPYIKIIWHKNTGHKALWSDNILKEYFSQYPWVAISDSDIELNQGTPRGFIEELVSIAKDYRVDKAGLAIRIDDIPESEYSQSIHAIEDRYWLRRLKHPTRKVYDAILDTTFSVVRTDTPYMWGPAVRVAGMFTCRHIPWYNDFKNLSEEEQYYIEHADIKISEHKQRYNNWKKENA